MKGNYIFEYFDEIKFKKCERSLKKYNMFAFKKLIFEFYPKMKEGEFLGDIVSTDEEKNTVSYELTLPADELFTKVHGEIVLHYDIYTNKNIILLKSISPEELFLEGHATELNAYKGVMISKENADKDMFKINLLNSMNKNGFLNISKKTLIILSLIFIAIVALVIYLIIK